MAVLRVPDDRLQGRKFGSTAADYDRGRPDWPAAAVDLLATGLGLSPSAVVVDLGAGTGKLTRRLVERFARVIAVEPLQPMRELLAANVPAADVRDGTAERLPLPSRTVNAVFVADAFHWFNGQAALAEAARVLVPDGGIGLLWHMDIGPWEPPLPEPAREMVRTAIARGGEPGGPRVARGEWRSAFARSPFGELHTGRVDHELKRDREGVIANAMSVSSIAGLPSIDREALRTRLRELVPPGQYRQQVPATLYWATAT